MRAPTDQDAAQAELLQELNRLLARPRTRLHRYFDRRVLRPPHAHKDATNVHEAIDQMFATTAAGLQQILGEVWKRSAAEQRQREIRRRTVRRWIAALTLIAYRSQPSPSSGRICTKFDHL